MPKFDATYVPQSAMAIFAHPDDAEFTVSGTIAKWARAGCEVTLVLCTSGNAGTHDLKYTRESLAETREAEQQAAAQALGVKNVVFLRHDDCQLVPTLELRRELVREIRKFKPEVVMTGDPQAWFYDNSYINHPDHRAAAIAALEAVFPCSEMELLWPEEGPVHKVHAVYVGSTNAPNTWIDISATIDAKIASLKAHASQMGDWDPSDMIREWAGDEARNTHQHHDKHGDKHHDKHHKHGKRDKRRHHHKDHKHNNHEQSSPASYVEGFRVMKLQEEEKPPES
jgi:LmbE family N-acetylglucosaminyl deacetylase